MAERAIQAEILAELGADPRWRMARFNTGKGWVGRFLSNVSGLVTLANARPIAFGFSGCPDILGFIRGGRSFGLEIKTASGRSTPEQVALGRLMVSFGQHHAVVRSVAEARAALESWL